MQTHRMPSRRHPRQRVRVLLAVGLGLLLATGCAGEGADVEGADDDHPVVVADARARMSPRMAGVAAAYMGLTNTESDDERLVAAFVDGSIAGRVEIHESFEVDDGPGGMVHGSGPANGAGQMHGAGPPAEGAPMMGMREIDGIDLPAGTTVELVPGGLHLMLMDLVDDLAPGDSFELTLSFAHAPDLVVTVEVREQV
jgi:periplasmic copper chaperone A